MVFKYESHKFLKPDDLFFLFIWKYQSQHRSKTSTFFLVIPCLNPKFSYLGGKMAKKLRADCARVFELEFVIMYNSRELSCILNSQTIVIFSFWLPINLRISIHITFAASLTVLELRLAYFEFNEICCFVKKNKSNIHRYYVIELNNS
jgi:hypothetical protein